MSSLKFYVKPGPGERVETDLTLPPPLESSIWGTVRAADGAPVASCMVLLYADGEALPLHQAVTDAEGRFCFGPLPGGQLYIINIYRDDVQIRTLEIGV